MIALLLVNVVWELHSTIRVKSLWIFFSQVSNFIMQSTKEKEITVLKVEPGKSPETVTMPNTLDAMQKMVGGYIEVLPLSDVCLVCNEDGKLLGLEGNRRLGNDIIVGTFFLAGDTRSGDLCSLTQEQIQHFGEVFAKPDTFQPGEVEDALRIEFYSI